MKILGSSQLHAFGAPELVPLDEKAKIEPGVLGIDFASMTTVTLCITVLAAQYFAVCTVQVVVRLIEQLRNDGKSKRSSVFEQTMLKAEMTVEFAPMLCVLFLASQMQAMHVSEGRKDPPAWMLRCMEVATVALVMQTMLTVVLPLCMDKPEKLDVDPDAGLIGGPLLWSQATSKLKSEGGAKQVMLGALLLAGTVVCYTAHFALYVACACVCLGMTILRTPQELIPAVNAGVPSAVSCTVNLTLQFFLVRLLITIVHAWEHGTMCRPRGRSSTLYEVLKLASTTVFFAPMLCVLFVCAHLRVRQVGRNDLQLWAEVALHVCTYAVLAQSLLTMVLPFLHKILPFLPCHIDARRGNSHIEADVMYEAVYTSQTWGSAIALFLLRYVPILLIFGGFSIVILGILTMDGPAGQPTPSVPPAMQCIMANTIQFFLVYFCLRVGLSARDATHGSHGDRGVAAKTLKSALVTVHFCPMLAILFVALRMRSQQIDGPEGAPQGWAQDAMYSCTIAVFLQLVVCLLIGVISQRAPEVDQDFTGISRVSKAEEGWNSTSLARLSVAVQAVLLATLYVGAIMVCAAIFLLTPETSGATAAVLGAGALFLSHAVF
mmetsp:Transcript_112460/g.195097  ORF Transcript_112460/g.195097 Transcript_112460/m.195097 type:complete len:605 (-) Transcript_112460:76-1890(-)